MADAPTPPACYREAEWDSNGFLAPSDPAEEGSAYFSLRRESGLRGFRVFQKPTTTWSEGKDAIIARRIDEAMGRGAAVEGFTARLEALGLRGASLDELPFDMGLRFLTFGLMDNEPAEPTRSALAVFHPLGLYSYLTLDPLVEKPRAPALDANKAVDELRAFESLLPILQTTGSRVVKPQLLRQVLLTLQKLMRARAAVAADAAKEERRRAEESIAMTPLREAGWTAKSVAFRREKIVALVEGLRLAEPDSWPIRRVAQLILAGEKDWSHALCPQLIEKYRHRQDDLEDLIKKDLCRAQRTQRTHKQSSE
jgi:hypothetical protein